MGLKLYQLEIKVGKSASIVYDFLRLLQSCDKINQLSNAGKKAVPAYFLYWGINGSRVIDGDK